ncbi:MAG: phosphorylase family protein [Phycisphaerales bacterium]
MSLSVVVLCPMAVEYRAVLRAVRRAGLTEREGVKVVQTGIGREAICRALRLHVPRGGAGCAVLAGLCGGLTEGPEAPALACIRDESGREWTSFLGATAGGATLVGVDRIIDTPAAKAELAQVTGASIVDMESHAFAAECTAMGVRFGVVRGVSDTPTETLPAAILGWITPAGETRMARAMLDLLRRPGDIPHIARFALRSRRVLPRVGEGVVGLIQRELGA